MIRCLYVEALLADENQNDQDCDLLIGEISDDVAGWEWPWDNSGALGNNLLSKA
jgi:hypothetical protein